MLDFSILYNYCKIDAVFRVRAFVVRLLVELSELSLFTLPRMPLEAA